MEAKFRRLLTICAEMGKLKTAKMYDETFCTVKVVDAHGEEYEITIQKNEREIKND